MSTSLRPGLRRSVRGMTALELLLAITLLAVLMAAVGPVLTGVLRSQRSARAKLEPLATEAAALGCLRADLAAAPMPRGTITRPLVLEAGWVGGEPASTLTFGTLGPSPLPDTQAVRPPSFGLQQVSYAVEEDGAKPGRLRWVRSLQPHLLAVGIPPDPTTEVLMDGLASLRIEALVGDAFQSSYDSDDMDAFLPRAVRVTWASVGADGKPGPERVAVLDLPQVAMDPLQQEVAP